MVTYDNIFYQTKTRYFLRAQMEVVKMKAEELAKWFINRDRQLTSGYIDENTKLNKLLYFSNLYTYSILNEKILSDDFVAFPNGPVVNSIYVKYRYKGLNLKYNEKVDIDSKYKKILEVVSFVYGNMNKDDLVNLTHDHNIWKEVKHLIPNNPKIIFEHTSPELMKKCREIFETYTDVDFSKIKKEVVGGNVYYYNTDNIKSLDEDTILKMMNIANANEPMFIEVHDGEIILS